MKKITLLFSFFFLITTFQKAISQTGITILSPPDFIDIGCTNDPEGYDTQLVYAWIDDFILYADVENECQDPDNSYTWTHDYSGQIIAGCSGIISINFTVTNSCGEFDDILGDVNISDFEPPILNPPSISEHTLLCDGDGNVIGLQEIIDNDFYFDPATDNCDDLPTLEYTLLTLNCEQTYYMGIYAVDNCFNNSTYYTITFNVISLNVEFSSNNFPVLESETATNVCLNLDNPSPEDIIVEVSYDASGTATSGIDHAAIPTTQNITFLANTTDQQCFTVNLLEDNLIEANETILFEITNITSDYLAGIGNQSSSKVTILDNDDNDNDDVENSVDNCPETFNPFQEDFDNDLIGDVCDDNTTISEISEFQDYIYINKLYSGVIVKSLDGQCWVMVVQNDGSLNTVSVSCPD